ncbi:MAG: hypothetical protein AAF192_18220, partial [Pseudomonadota bacterium]
MAQETPKPSPDAAPQSPADEIARSASESTLALNPIVGVRGQDLLAAGAGVMRVMASQPQMMAKAWMGFAAEMGDIMLGRSER